MPIYEYRCGRCGRRSSFLVRSIASRDAPACPHCRSRRMARAVSRVAVLGGRKGARRARPAAEAAGTPDSGGPPGAGGFGGGGEPDLAAMESMFDGVDETDPRSVGRAMRKLAETAGEPIEGEMEEVVRRLESGEDPEAIEDTMGDAFAGDGGGGEELYDG